MNKIIDFFLGNSESTNIADLEFRFDKMFGPDRDFKHYLKSYYKERSRLGYADHARKLKKLVDRLSNKRQSKDTDSVEVSMREDVNESLETQKATGIINGCYSINDGEQLLKSKSLKIYNDLVELQNQVSNMRSKEKLEERIERFFSDRDWIPEYPLSKNRGWAMDYVSEYDRIGVEIEFGNSREMIYRDIMRFDMLKETRKIDIGIIITYENYHAVAKRNSSETSQRQGDSNPYMTLNYIAAVYRDYQSSIKVPLWCVGV